MQKIFVITAPSGSGKSTIAKAIMKRCPELSFSVSATTRLPRGQEVDGVDYYFMSVPDFIDKIENDEFLEWEMVYEGKYYGTLHAEIARIHNEGRVALLDIDVVGAAKIKERYPDEVFVFFIKPPSLAELRKRLTARGTDSPEVIEERIAKASYEMGFEKHFDQVIINDDVAVAIDAFYNHYCKQK